MSFALQLFIPGCSRSSRSCAFESAAATFGDGPGEAPTPVAEEMPVVALGSAVDDEDDEPPATEPDETAVLLNRFACTPPQPEPPRSMNLY